MLIKSEEEARFEGRQWPAPEKMLISSLGSCLIGSLSKATQQKLGKESREDTVEEER